jgi:hypothetical protein
LTNRCGWLNIDDMTIGRAKWLAFLLLCFYGVALAHQVLPHGHTGDEAAACGLCVLVFATTLAACATVLVLCTRRVSLCPLLRPLPYAIRLWRSPCLRGPPRFV